MQRNLLWLPASLCQLARSVVRREIPCGFLERQGLYEKQRPAKNPLMWFHANSAGAIVVSPYFVADCFVADYWAHNRVSVTVSLSDSVQAAYSYAGECVLCLPLIHRVVVEYNEKVLILVTVRSEDALELLQSSLPDRVLLIRAPYDTPFAVSRFLEHWRPCIGVMMSWLAPNLVVMSAQVCITDPLLRTELPSISL
jgi:3-deoxy-D-manno-octulosonic-acid transferase